MVEAMGVSPYLAFVWNNGARRERAMMNLFLAPCLSSEESAVRRWILVLPLLVGLGCGEREPVQPDPSLAAPVLLSVSPDPWTLVSDTTIVEVMAENVDNVSFHLGNTVLGSDDAPPFVLAWKTKQTQNGVRSLTIRGTSDAGSADTTITYMVGNLDGERVVVVFPQTATVGSPGTVRFSVEVLGAADKRVDWGLRPADELESEGPFSVKRSPTLKPVI
jgi:hypothetical protein